MTQKTPTELPLERRLQVWAAVSPPQGDFHHELLKAADEVIDLKRQIKTVRLKRVRALRKEVGRLQKALNDVVYTEIVQDTREFVRRSHQAGNLLKPWDPKGRKIAARLLWGVRKASRAGK